MADFATLREQEYRQRLEVERLRRLVYEQTDPTATKDLMDQLVAAEKDLSLLETQREQVQAADKTISEGVLVNTKTTSNLAGAESTGLEVVIEQKMSQLPTAICHLFDPEMNPLVSCTVTHRTKNVIRRVRVTSFIE